MKKFIIILFLLCFVRDSFNLTVNSCEDAKDKVLVALETRSISIGCYTNSKLLDCSIANVRSSKKCSLRKCEFGNLKIQDDSSSMENVCQFELSNLNLSGDAFKF